MLAGIVIITYMLGAFSAAKEIPPYPHIEKGFQALEAHIQKLAVSWTKSAVESSVWRRAELEGVGVVRHEPQQSFGGYTLFTSGHASGAQLIDMDGNVVHEWKLGFHEAWPDPPHVAYPIPEPFILWARAHVFPNGDLLGIYVASDDTPQGYGMVKLDRDSNVVWRYAERTHHDFDVAADGSIYALVSEFRDMSADPVSVPLHPAYDGYMLDSYVVRLSAEGEELTRVSLLDALADSEHWRLLTQLDLVTGESWDPLHPNNVERVGEEFAEHHGFAEPDDLLISFRNIDLIVLLDLDEAEIVWATRGAWRHQHDPDPLPNGNIMLFDNRGHTGDGQPSRITEFDPRDGTVEWSYAGSQKEPFHSQIRGSQQLLPNGNVLVTDTETGRVLEVARTGEIVWEFRNPAQKTVDGQVYVGVVQGAVRLESDALDFVDNR